MGKTPVKRGRPAGMRARKLESKQTLLEHPNVAKVVETVIRAALDDNHENQAAAKGLNGSCAAYKTFEKGVDRWEEITIVINTIRPGKEASEGEVIE